MTRIERLPVNRRPGRACVFKSTCLSH